MKKILSVSLASVLLLIGSIASAQSGKYNMATTNGLYLDTVVNAGAKSATVQVNGYMKTVAVQVTVTKISGTVGGTAVLQGSLDGVNYYNVTGASSFTLTDVANQGTAWSLVDPGYLYYRVLVTGSGTMSASLYAYLIARKLTQ